MAWSPRTPPDAVRRPRMQVIAQPGSAKENMLPWGGIDITTCVERLQTTKMIRNPAGQFSITCTYEPPPGWQMPLSRILVPMNLIEISLDTGLPETTFEVVMRGWLNAVEESESMDGRGRPSRSITLVGQDCGQFFLRHEMRRDTFTLYAWGSKEAAKRAESGVYIMGSCGDVLHGIFKAVFVEQNALLAVAEEGQLLTEPILHNEADGAAEDFWQTGQVVESIWDANGRFWSLFQQYVDRPWNEVFGDYVPNLATSPYANYWRASAKRSDPSGGPGYYLIVRRTPFSRGRWEKLPETIIYDSEVKLARTRSDDNERVNLVITHPAGGGFDSTSDVPGRAADLNNLRGDADSIRRYGTLTKEETTRYFDVWDTPQDPEKQRQYQEGTGELAAVMGKRTMALWNWFSINHLLTTGVIVTAGMPYLRIGEKVRGQPAEMGSSYFIGTEQLRQTWYIEQVVQDFSEGSAYTTHLGLTRGQQTGTFLEALKTGIDIAGQIAAGGEPVLGGP